MTQAPMFTQSRWQHDESATSLSPRTSGATARGTVCRTLAGDCVWPVPSKARVESAWTESPRKISMLTANMTVGHRLRGPARKYDENKDAHHRRIIRHRQTSRAAFSG